MLAFDMGGPCNKVAYAFALACMETGNYAPIGRKLRSLLCTSISSGISNADRALRNLQMKIDPESQDVSLEHYV